MFDRPERAFNARTRKLSRTITHADLTEAVNGQAQAIALGTLPPGAIVLGRASVLSEYFTGGGATAVTMQFGTAADPDAVMSATNVFDTTAQNVPLQGVAGVGPLGPYSGELQATFTPDGGHNLNALNAGSVLVEIYFTVPDGALS
ncbi:MAG: hypothetical protein ACOY0T_37545 [Myxococcota bacterium]